MRGDDSQKIKNIFLYVSEFKNSNLEAQKVKLAHDFSFYNIYMRHVISGLLYFYSVVLKV